MDHSGTANSNFLSCNNNSSIGPLPADGSRINSTPLIFSTDGLLQNGTDIDIDLPEPVGSIITLQTIGIYSFHVQGQIYIIPIGIFGILPYKFAIDIHNITNNTYFTPMTSGGSLFFESVTVAINAGDVNWPGETMMETH